MILRIGCLANNQTLIDFNKRYSDQFAEKNRYKIGDNLTLSYKGITISGKIVGLVKSGEMMICTADENQLMPDYTTFGFACITPQKLESAMGRPSYPIREWKNEGQCVTIYGISINKFKLFTAFT